MKQTWVHILELPCDVSTEMFASRWTLLLKEHRCCGAASSAYVCGQGHWSSVGVWYPQEWPWQHLSFRNRIWCIPYGQPKVDSDLNPDQCQLHDLLHSSGMLNAWSQNRVHCPCRLLFPAGKEGLVVPRPSSESSKARKGKILQLPVLCDNELDLSTDSVSMARIRVWMLWPIAAPGKEDTVSASRAMTL